jgi:uncharacterized OsmC-like protein
VLKRITVRYRLRAGEDVDDATAERVHGFHAERCPVYRSVHPQIEVATSLDIER